MKTLLIGINAKFSHTNLAIRYLRNSLMENKSQVLIFEASVNDRKEDVLREIYKSKADIFCFSSYIWNIDFVISLAKDIKTLLPNSKVILGGPEISYNSQELIDSFPFIDCIICGEGEETLPIVVKDLEQNKSTEKIIFSNNIKQEDIKFPYLKNEISELKDKIIYYETSRGCPFNCTYCLSGGKGKPRFKDLKDIKTQLKQIINEGAKLIKFVDRSFNCNRQRAYEIFSFLKETQTNATFHFEICAELLIEEDFELLKGVPKGKFQFEIGIQSTNQKSLEEIDRKFNVDTLLENIKRLKELKNIHIHCDLIAGLPFEDINSFKNSFVQVYNLCEVLQLGFLKVLKGTKIKEKATNYGLIYSENAPYEIFKNNWLSFEDILELKRVEETLNRFSNSKAFSNSIKYLGELYNSPYKMFCELAEFLKENNALFNNVSRKNEFLLLYNFAKSKGIAKSDFYEYLRLDFVSSMKGEPPFQYNKYNEEFYKKCKEFFNNSQNVEKYIPKYKNETQKNINKNCDIHLFNFEHKLVLLFDRKSGKIIDISKSPDFL